MLKCKVAIYVPSTINVNQSIDNTKQIENTCLFLSGIFGGCTAYNASGKWIDSKNNLISESITICFSYCTKKQLRKAKKDVLNYVKSLCQEMKQDCISLEINNRLYFIN